MRNRAIQLRRKGYSIDEIAKELNRAKSTVSKYFSGTRKPNTDKLHKGEVKIRPNQKIYKSLSPVKKKTIPIRVGDPKNTIIYIREGDCPKKAINKYMNR